MQAQESETDARKRKLDYDQVQQLVASELPIVTLVSPNILVGAKAGLANFEPSILDHYTCRMPMNSSGAPATRIANKKMSY
jgi:ABC-type transport system substrate-binding protein